MRDHSNGKAVVGNGDPGLRFRLGTFFFALAHMAYTAGFAQEGAFKKDIFISAVVISLGLSYSLGLPGGVLGTRRWRTIPSDMTPLVRGYIGITTLMAATATATGGYQMILGA